MSVRVVAALRFFANFQAMSHSLARVSRRRVRHRLLPCGELGRGMAHGGLVAREGDHPRCTSRKARKRGDTLAITKRSEEHTSELQSLMRISYAVFCLKKKIKTQKPEENTRESI